MDVDAVVVSYESRDHLRGCVEPLAHLPGVHVVVVDNASTDGSLDAVADLPVETRALPDNRGFSAGCNAGFRVGSAPLVLFLNPDAHIDERSLRLLAHVLETEPGVGAVGPRIAHPDGSLHYSQRRFPRLRSSFAQALFLHRVVPRAGWSDEVIRDDAAYERRGSPDWVSGACIMLRRADLERLGGWDEGFFLYSEETDLCRRLRDAGLEVRYEPEARALHLGGASAPRTSLLPVLAASRVRYARKHQGAAAATLVRLAIALGALARLVVARGGLRARAGHARAALRVAFRAG